MVSNNDFWIEVAIWKTSGKDYLILSKNENHNPVRYRYQGNGCGGSLPNFTSDSEAICWMEQYPVKTLKMDRPSIKRIS